MHCLIKVIQRGQSIEAAFNSLNLNELTLEAESRPVVIRGIYSNKDVIDLRNKVLFDFEEYKSLLESRYYYGCPNVYKLLNRDYHYYRPERRHLWNYFMWNRKPDHIIYDIGISFTRLINSLAGLPSDYGHDPACGHFYTLSTMLYPKGGGFLAPHVDSYFQKYQALLIMSKLGEDFYEGGSFCFDSDNKNHFIEPELERGDVLLLPSTVVHGVYPIDPKIEDENPFSGRWAFFTPMPNSNILVDGPGVSKPISLDNHFPKKI